MVGVMRLMVELMIVVIIVVMVELLKYECCVVEIRFVVRKFCLREVSELFERSERRNGIQNEIIDE